MFRGFALVVLLYCHKQLPQISTAFARSCCKPPKSDMGLCCSRGKLPPHLAVKYAALRPSIDGGDLPSAHQSCEFIRSFDNSLWLFSRTWQPHDKSSVWATLMIVHGTVDHSGVYAELGEFLAMQGVAVFASDMRGWGRSDGEPLYVDSIDSFMGDIVSDYQRIHAAGSPYAKVRSRFLLGKSIGGLFAAWTAAEHVSKWTGLIGLSGAFQIDPSVKPSAVALMFVKAMATCAPKMGLKPPFDPKLIVSDTEALRAWERDPLVSRGKLLGFPSRFSCGFLLASCCGSGGPSSIGYLESTSISAEHSPRVLEAPRDVGTLRGASCVQGTHAKGPTAPFSGSLRATSGRCFDFRKNSQVTLLL